MKIRQLPESLANKIAAGEVVERPVSVVKELVENSIDAKSDWIKIELHDAGLQRIKVIDNGIGMGENDCKRSVLRHATSKIKYDTDLFHITSLGFRGEALASIAAVSKLTIQSSTGKQAGTKLYLEAGEIIETEKSDARQGTTITVEQLFYNTPARLKYMKTVHTELGHITDLLNRYALAQPHIRFEVIHNDRTIFSTTGSGHVLQVIAMIYGTNVAQNMLAINGETNDFKLTGYISKPEITRASRNYLTFIINGRYIKSQQLNHAVLRAYETLLPIHRSPIVIIDLKMDPILVDVNVHPTKLDVRFSKEADLINLIEQTIKSKFQTTNLIPTITKPKKNETKREKAVQTEISFTENKQRTNQHMTEKKKPQIDIKKEYKTNEMKVKDAKVSQEEQSLKRNYNPLEEKTTLPKLYPIGQFRGTYILAQNEEGFYMIDQHAAQERIKYEYYKEKLTKPAHELQNLLIPLTFELTKEEQLFIKNYKEKLATVGLYFEQFGTNTFAVRSYPRWFPEGEEEHIIRDMVEQIVKDGKINLSELREELAIMLSCKRSIKANEYLSEKETEQLLADLAKTKVPYTCPHGRPVIITFTNNEVEKMFKRIM